MGHIGCIEVRRRWLWRTKKIMNGRGHDFADATAGDAQRDDYQHRVCGRPQIHRVLYIGGFFSKQPIAQQLIDFLSASCPGTHQPINIRLDEFVKVPPSGVQLLDQRIGKANEH